MEEVLKGLQGKTLTKKMIFDLLAGIDLETILGTDYDENLPALPKKLKPKKEVFKCTACGKVVTAKSSLVRHHLRFPVCKKWIEENKVHSQIDKGVHLLIVDIFEKVSSKDNNLECKFCNTSFVSRSNLNKHFNVSSVCNQLCFQEFKKAINEI
jgi:hypothetical protein